MSVTGRQRGFTLLELMVVLAILTLAMTAVPFAIDRAFPRQQLRVAAQDIATELRALREEAVAANQVAELKLDEPTSARGYRLSPVGRSGKLPSPLVMTFESARASAAADSLRFYPDGSASGGVLVIEARGRKGMVKVSALTGRIEVAAQ